MFILLMLLFSVNVIKNIDNNNKIDELQRIYTNQEDLDNELINKIQKKISKGSFREADRLFLQGYISLKVDNNYKLAKRYFNLCIDNIDKYTSNFAKIYAYKFLADIEFANNNTIQGIDYLQDVFNNINHKRYNNDYKLISDIIYSLINRDNTLAIKYIEDILKYEDNLDNNAKQSMYVVASILYTLDSNYVAAIEYNLDAIELSLKLKDYYRASKSIVNIGIIFRQSGSYETAIRIISEVDNIEIKDIYLKSDLNIYKLINLAELNIILGNYEDGLKNIKEIQKYKKYVDKDELAEIQCIENISMAQIYLYNDNLDLAQEHLKKAFDILKIEDKNIYLDKSIYYDIVYGKLEKSKGNYLEAINSFENGIEKLNQVKNSEYYEICVNELLNLYNITKDDKAIEYSNKLLEIKNEKNKIIADEYYSYIINKYNYTKFNKEKIQMRNKYIIISVIILIIVSILSIKEIYPLIKRLKLKNKVKKHLNKNEYKLFYQPIINPKKDEIIGFEALLRLKINDTIVMPSKIIKEIEDSKMMKEVSIWILNRLIDDYEYIRKINSNISKFYLSMNISLNEIEDDNMINIMNDILKKSNLEEKTICLEITENIGGKDFNKIKNNINKLIECGFIIAIDDFGVDYSNISLIDKFEFNILKLDKYFIDNLDTSKLCINMIEVFEVLSEKRDISIVMEGVETTNQKDFIKCLSSEKFYIQGYFYSKPMEIDMIRKFKINK